MNWEKIVIALVSAAFAVILYILLPIESGKYRLKIVGEEANFKLVSRAYHDMDGDGKSEIVRFKTGVPVPAITLEGSNGEILGQWNLHGDWLESTKGQFADLDRDGYAELVTLTYFQDSIWLHVIEPLQEGGTFLQIPVDGVELYNDHQDWLINFGTPCDINADGMDEIYFTIRAGFTLQPRKLYVFDGKQKELMVQEAALGNNIAWPVCLDIDQDGVMEITGKVSAPGNLSDQDVLYSDSCAWLMIYDQDLQFKVEPVSYPGSPSYLYVLALKKGSRQLLVSCHHSKTKTEIINHMEVREWLNGSLQIMASRDLQSETQILMLSVDPNEDGVFVVVDGTQLIWLDEALREKDRLEVDAALLPKSYSQMDIDGDGISEQVFYTGFSTLHIFQSDFRHGLDLDLGYNASEPVISSFTRDKKHFVNVYRGSQNILLSYSKNPFYNFRFLILLLSFFLYYAIFTLLQGIQKRRIEARQASERQVLHYQLTNVMQQLDPHFLFNALSNISSYYHKGDREHAQSYLAKVSRLVRTTLENSERMSISLGEELNFVRDYLSVEQIRMGDRLNFGIEAEKSMTEQIQVPKMLIQNFVENALKHGIRHLKGRAGVILIYAERAGNYYRVLVEDNGVGRKNAAAMGSTGTGSGLQMVQKSLDIFEKLEKIRINFQIEDVVDEAGQVAGTRVLIKIPLR